MAGIRVFHQRLLRCRGGYRMRATASGGFEVILADGTVIPETDASEVVMRPFYEEARRLEKQLNNA